MHDIEQITGGGERPNRQRKHVQLGEKRDEHLYIFGQPVSSLLSDDEMKWFENYTPP